MDEDQENRESRGKGEDDDVVMQNTRHGIRGPLRILKHEQKKAAADYATRSLEQRYAVDNDYIGFKRLWWDAVHGVDGKPLPDASRWLRTIILVVMMMKMTRKKTWSLPRSTSVSTARCLWWSWREPYTSSVCKHTFNKPAIVQFLRSQPGIGPSAHKLVVVRYDYCFFLLKPSTRR